MNKENYKINDDGDYLNSVSKVDIPWLERLLDVWVDLDNEQKWFTPIQINALEKLISLPNSNKINVRTELEKVYFNELKKNRIQNIEYVDILETINWRETQICIPQHGQSENHYALLLPETNWKLVDSNFTLELELLFTNNKIELCQEMSGLWCRPEWFEYYLKRPKSVL
ncbi:hypothetical protein [Aquimarina sp. 2201CG14-23]|uniref:hypothetical protein n=1 Tax=Aquimarina mycalae TaxID=3040073 RepID=UPI002477E09F|nr:hypothetical protein [Aquimarina sp. 2201CG14-23]MDH7447593.1 hypothetical protein [Aquimarina sp. 2201CG14-23]